MPTTITLTPTEYPENALAITASCDASAAEDILQAAELSFSLDAEQLQIVDRTILAAINSSDLTARNTTGDYDEAFTITVERH